MIRKKFLNLFLVLTLLVSTISIPLTVGAVADGSIPLVTSEDNFNSTTLNAQWTKIQSYGLVYMSTAPDTNNYALSFWRQYNASGRAATQSASILAVNDPYAGGGNAAHVLDSNDVVNVEAKIACRTNMGGGRMEVFNNNGDSIVSIVMGAADATGSAITKTYVDNYPQGISMHTGGFTGATQNGYSVIDTSAVNLLPSYTTTTTGASATPTYYAVKMTFNFRTKTLDVYIDGVKLATNVAFRSTATTCTNIGNVLFCTNGNNAGLATLQYAREFMVDDFKTTISNEELSSTPSVSNLKIIGDATVNSTVSSSYTYTSSKTEGETQYEWAVCDTSDGIYTAITGQTAKTMVITPELANKYIKVTVTPKNIDGLEGVPLTSDTKFVLPSGAAQDLQYQWHNDLTSKSVTISKINNSPRSTTAKAIVSKYDSSGMLNDIVIANIPADLAFEATTTIDYTGLTIAAGETVKLFILDSMSNLKPIGIENTNAPSSTAYSLTMPVNFNSNMVLQRDEGVDIWGKYKPFSVVTVSFAGQYKTTTSNAIGDWKVTLDPMEASAVDKDLVISTMTDCIIYKNVLVGDVFMVTGQSNAEMGMYWFTDNSQMNPASPEVTLVRNDIASANYPSIRYTKAGYTSYDQASVPTMLNEYTGMINTPWEKVSPTSASLMSATSFYFARELYTRLGSTVPIGIVCTAKAGMPIQQFLPNGSISSADGTYAANGYIYNELIAPYLKYSFKGIIYYQGESDITHTDYYIPFFKKMTEIYRANFNKPNMPFYYVQVAPRDYTGKSQEKIIEAQRQLLSYVENCYMAIIPDGGDIYKTSNVHPLKKDIVGQRLVNLALHYTYGQTDVYPYGPLYKSYTVDGNSIKVKFDYVGDGLKLKSGSTDVTELTSNTGFKIAGADGVFYNATVKVTETATDEITLTSTSVTNPVNVQYLYAQWPGVTTLYNSVDLPASAFTSNITFTNAVN